MRGLLWRLPWFFFALMCLYILFYRWQLELLTLTPIAAVTTTRALMQQGQYAEAADEVAYFLDLADAHDRSELEALAAEIDNHRSSLDYQTEKIQEGLLTGSSDELSGQVTGLATSMLVIGDIRDLVKEGLHWLHNEETDELIVALSSIGVVATAVQLISFGTTSPIKAGISVTKVAHQAGAIPPWLRQHLIQGSSKVLETRSLAPVIATITKIQRLIDHVGYRQGFALLGLTRDPGSLNRMAQVAKHLGPATGPLMRLGGDAALAIAPQIEKLGIANLKLASRYGPQGLHTLVQVGPVRFVKYGARLAKLGYTYPWMATLANYLLKVPAFMWVVGTILGLLFGLRWPWRKLLLS